MDVCPRSSRSTAVMEFTGKTVLFLNYMSKAESNLPYLVMSKRMDNIHAVSCSVVKVCDGDLEKEMKMCFFGCLKKHPLKVVFRVPLAWSPKLFLSLLWVECYSDIPVRVNATILINIDADIQGSTRVRNVCSMRQNYFPHHIDWLNRVVEVSVSEPFILGGED